MAGLQRVIGLVDLHGYSEIWARSRDFRRPGVAGRFSDGNLVRPGQDRRQEELGFQSWRFGEQSDSRAAGGLLSDANQDFMGQGEVCGVLNDTPTTMKLLDALPSALVGWQINFRIPMAAVDTALKRWRVKAVGD